MSDVFMRNVFKKRECTEYDLQVIMGRKDLKVLDQVIRVDYKNLQGRRAILDCAVRDGEWGSGRIMRELICISKGTQLMEDSNSFSVSFLMCKYVLTIISLIGSIINS